MAIAKKDKISFFQLEFQPFERIPFERHMVSQKKKKKKCMDIHAPNHYND